MEFLELIDYSQLLIFLVVSLVLTLLLYLIVSGLFAKIEIKTGESKYGPMVIAYKTQVGPYKQAGQLFTDSYCLLPHRVQIGIYYDDPEAVPENELRFAVGPVLSSSEDETPNKEEMDLMVSHGFRIFHVPKPNFVVTTEFPFRTTVSIYLGIFRVYPKLRKYISERNLCAYPAIEVYADQEIVFIMPLSRQEEFFVPEFQEEQVSVATTDIGSTAGDRLAALKDDDLFLKPRTPVRVNQRQSSQSIDQEPSNAGSSEEKNKSGNTSESEDDASGTTSSFDGLDDLNQNS